MGGPSIVIPAAGRARRMRGVDKLLMPVAGVALLRDRTLTAIASGMPVILVLRADDTARSAAIQGLGVTVIPVIGPDEGLGHSLAAAAKAVPPDTALMILPADMPDIETSDIAVLAAKFHEMGGQHIIRGATQSGQPGHPVVFPARFCAPLTQLSGDTGARSLLKGQKVTDVTLQGDRAICDLDTPEAWAAWRQRQV